MCFDVREHIQGICFAYFDVSLEMTTTGSATETGSTTGTGSAEINGDGAL